MKLSRRKIAAYYAEQLVAGKDITKQLAAYLVATHRTRESTLVVRDIEVALAERGVLVADIASSRSLSPDAKKAITAYLETTTGAKKITYRESVEPELLGGVRITLPGSELDTTLRRKLNQLKASKI